MLKEDNYFIYNVQRERNAKYVAQYAILVVLDVFYKLLFTLFPHRSKQKKYTFSIVSVFKNEASYMREWIEFHLLMGTDHFYLYNNNSTDNFLEVLKPYVEQGIVTLTEWPEIPGQISAYKNWYDNYRHESNWISFLDLDEFLCPTDDSDIKQWLEKHCKYPLYAIYWRMFGTSGCTEGSDEQLVMERYTSCWDKLASATKLIYNTDFDIERFFTSMMHKFCVKWHGLSVPPINMFGYFVNKWEIHRCGGRKANIQCNHYWSKSYEEYEAKHKRGDAVWDKGKSKRDMGMFCWTEHYCRAKDYKIQRFLTEMKLRMNKLQNIR